MIFSSLPLFLCIINFFGLSGLIIFFSLGCSLRELCCFFLVFAFLVRFPIFMFHFWLPRAHVESPARGSIILAGVMLKLGGFGLIRFSLFIYDFFIFYR